MEIVQETESAPPTPSDSHVVKILTRAVEHMYKAKAIPTGVGGGTVANYLRKKGIPTAVWARHDKVAHQPNEYCRIRNIAGDAEIYSFVFTHRV